jgi:hypothetical protein
MTFLRKIVLLSGLLFLFCLVQSENKSQNISIAETQKDTYLHQKLLNSSYFIQTTKVHLTAISKRFHTPSFTLFTVLFFTLDLANNEGVAAKAFSSKSINRVAKVSFLLYPVHYFW